MSLPCMSKFDSSKMYAFKPFVFIKHHVVGPEKPKARSGHRVVCDERNLYSYGGFNPSITANDPDMRNDQNWSISRPLFKEIWKFNFVTKTWKRLPCQKVMPNELASNAIVLKGFTLIIHGGTGVPFGDNCNNNVYLYNVNGGEMKIIPAEGESPSPQYGQAVIYHGPYLYTVGGTTGVEYTCDIHRLNMQTQVWESVYICGGRDQCEPKGRYRHEIAFDGRIIYVLGGGTASEAFNLEDIPAFDTLAKKWKTLCTQGDSENFPAPRRCHGLVQYVDEITGSTLAVISGGYNGSQVFNDVWRLDLNSLKWTCLRTCLLPQPAYFHSIALSPVGQMFTFGGIVKEENEVARTDKVHSVWLTIPKLSEICWEALNFYYPHIKVKPQSYLLRIGIPSKFVQRLEDTH